ncbi:MAG TPA: hypothetical protein VF926_05750 [Mycobacterium sp.]
MKPVAGPCGVAITTRLWTTPDDEHVLDLVAEHLGRLRRADLARVCHPVPLDPNLDGRAKLLVRRDRLNTRKKALTAESSARWANAIIAANDAQYRLARDVQHRHRPGTRGTKSRPPVRTGTRLLGRATVTPAPANTGQPHQ